MSQTVKWIRGPNENWENGTTEEGVLKNQKEGYGRRRGGRWGKITVLHTKKGTCGLGGGTRSNSPEMPRKGPTARRGSTDMQISGIPFVAQISGLRDPEDPSAFGRGRSLKSHRRSEVRPRR